MNPSTPPPRFEESRDIPDVSRAGSLPSVRTTSRTSTPRASHDGSDNSPGFATPSSSYKDEKKKYNEDKAKRKKKGPEPTVAVQVIKEGNLKVRSLMKSWHKVYCKIYPGQLRFYSDSTAKKWMATISLFGGEVMERPTKKNGFGFKYINKNFHYEPKGPKGEMFFNIHILPNDYCIMRTVKDEERKSWIGAIQDAIAAALQQDLTLNDTFQDSDDLDASPVDTPNRVGGTPIRAMLLPQDTAMSTAQTAQQPRQPSTSNSNSTANSNATAIPQQQQQQHQQAPQVTARHARKANLVQDETKFKKAQARMPQPKLTFDTQRYQLDGDAQTLLWNDLAAFQRGDVIPPTAIPSTLLGTRSYLETLADPFVYCSLLHQAAKLDDPKQRMLKVLEWYLSGLSVKGAGPKLPIPPRDGEVYRCAFDNTEASNLTYVLAEKILGADKSCVMAQNREGGWVVDACLSRTHTLFGWGLAVEDGGKIRVTLLDHLEQYIITAPAQQIRGITLGRAVWEYTGAASIVCETTKYSASLNFSPVQHLESGGDNVNAINGSISTKLTKVGDLSGQWDKGVMLRSDSGDEVIFQNNANHHKLRVPLLTVEPSQLITPSANTSTFFDSTLVWSSFAKSIKNNSFEKASAALKEAYAQSISLTAPSLFTPLELDDDSEAWGFKFANLSPWNAASDFYISSQNGVISVLQRNDPVFGNRLKEIEGTVQIEEPPTKIKKAASSSSTRKNAVAKRPSTLSSTATPSVMYVDPLTLEDIDESIDEGDMVSTEAVNELKSENSILRKRIEALEREQGYLFHYYMPLWAILLSLIHILWESVPGFYEF